MRYLRISTLVIFAASILFAAWANIQYYGNINTEPPQLQGSTDTLAISVADGEKAIFRGLTAEDAIDGDLTDQIMVSSVSHFIEPATVMVKYVVFDSHNNSASFSRKVFYTDYTAPRFSLSKTPVYTVGKSFDLLSYIQVQDSLDGEISDHVRVISNMVNCFSAGVYPVVLEVSNSCGDTEQVTIWVTYTTKENTALIALRDHIVYVEQGQQLDPYAYISSVTDLQNRPLDQRNLTVQGNPDMETPGAYQITYSYADSTRSGQTTLTVVVTERQA